MSTLKIWPVRPGFDPRTCDLGGAQAGRGRDGNTLIQTPIPAATLTILQYFTA